MSNRKKGFTLIELLVVIAIIALLVSILLPSLAAAKRLAKRTICQSNLNGWGKAAAMFVGEHGYVPQAISTKAKYDGRVLDLASSPHSFWVQQTIEDAGGGYGNQGHRANDITIEKMVPCLSGVKWNESQLNESTLSGMWLCPSACSHRKFSTARA